MKIARSAGLKPRHYTCLFVFTLAVTASAQQPPRPADTPRSVTLSLAEYNRLLDLASRPSPAGVPVGAVVSAADLNVRVEGETARGVFNLTGEALRPGYSRVALVSSATLVEASAAGRPLPLVTEGKVHAALVSGPGAFALALEWGAPLSFAPGRASFVVPVPQSGTARMTLDLPGEQADVRLSAGLITRRVAQNGRTIVDATLDPGSATEVSWSMRDSAPAAAAKEARTLAEVMTLITIGESDVRLTTLVDLTVVQGEPRSFSVRLPAGYELTGVTGSSLETSQVQGPDLVLAVADPAARSHQFLIGLDRPHRGGAMQFETAFASVRDVQRERGEVAIEGAGTIELTAAERDGLHRLDVRELSASLHALARLPVLAGFRYQRALGAPGAAGAQGAPALALDVKRFADAGVLAAVADRAVATTMVTSEGRALTEIALDVQNRAQPFLKLTLPQGATMVSAEVAGQTAKPVAGTDGIRVPLLRPGFRPTGVYRVSFVYMHAGVPFAKKGDLRMTLPKMDIPVGIVEWELFVPERYSARAIDGNVISSERAYFGHDGYRVTAVSSSAPAPPPMPLPAGGKIVVSLTSEGLRGQIRGRVTDAVGSVVAGATISLASGRAEQTLVTAADGTFVASGIPAGQVTIGARLTGFAPASTTFMFDERPHRVDIALAVGMLSETVHVVSESPTLDTSRVRARDEGARMDREPQAPSQNVVNLQKRAAGVLPVRVDVPRAGTSHQFVKPLVVDQEVFLSLRYKRK
jgi:hypothetical protein